MNGRYETTYDVTNYLNLALDAAKMSESDDFETTMDIYENGVGGDTTNNVTLQGLSLTSEEEMKANPFYHMFRYAFWDLGYNKEGEDDGYFDGEVVEHYADTVVQDLFALDIPEIESDAALVMQVWMASVNGIFRPCRTARRTTAMPESPSLIKRWHCGSVLARKRDRTKRDICFTIWPKTQGNDSTRTKAKPTSTDV